MRLSKIPFSETRAFTPFFLDYIQQRESLAPFYNSFPTLENAGHQIKEKASFPQVNRDILTDTLLRQYGKLPVAPQVKQHIEALRDGKTFTVTTGHQLNIFTGPLYFVYKIITVINTCRQLKARHPEYTFVPVYWMASEDHDYEEIKYFRLYGKKYVWDTDQQGAVGKFSTKGFDALLKELPGELKPFQEAYTKNARLSDAVRQYVNALFQHEGLVVIDADDRSLKSLFRPVIREDVFTGVSKKLVDDATARLESLGYKTQIHCREINFFYLDNQLRGRIEKNSDRYSVLDTTLSFSQEEIEHLIENEPEKFSPNVILRPLYQEIILPNLAYVGGPAEVIYWLQLKTVFDHFHTPFPLIMPRNFAMVMDAPTVRKFEKTSLELKDLFEEKNFLFNHWVLKNAPQQLTVGPERQVINDIFEKLRARAESIDKTLGPFAAAEGKRALNSLEKIERKFIRAGKRLNSDKLRQIEAVKDVLFPNGSLQERTDNLLNFYQQDEQFINKAMALLDPFDYQFNILSYPD